MRGDVVAWVGVVLLGAMPVQAGAMQGGTMPAAAEPQACVLKLRMDARGRVFEAGHRLTHDALVRRLQAGCAGGSGPLRVFLDASPQARYGAVYDLTNLVTQNGPPGTQLEVATKFAKNP